MNIGYYLDRYEHCARTVAVSFVETAEELRLAELEGHSVTLWVNLPDGVREVGYEWGDQAAAAFALVKGGNLLDYTQGCGDGSPYLTGSEAECLVAGRLLVSSQKEDNEKCRLEAERAFERQAHLLGLWGELQKLSCGSWGPAEQARYEELTRKVDSALVRAEADERAEAEETGILARLIRHYRRGMNPLRSLRRECGGEWSFWRECPPEELWKTASVFHGDGWWVVWQKPD